jgi:hypothetical protein
MVAARYLVVHEGTETILDLSECKIAVVKEGNEMAEEAVDNDDVEELLNSADAIFDENQITLG